LEASLRPFARTYWRSLPESNRASLP
jgi:hypothetical protein